MSAPNINRILKNPRSPLASDVFIFQRVDVSKPENKNIPEFGTPYATMGAAVKEDFPNHKFAWREGPGEDGLYTNVFIADLVTQHLYNWEINDEPQWPTITQTFVILRSAYVASPADPETTYPPPPSEKIDLTGYEITATQEVRSGNERLDSLYVVVQVQREKIDTPLEWQEFDVDTGQVRNFTRQKVPAGTSGSTTNDSGTYSETTPFNQYWSILDTKQAAGLAGGAIDGVSTRNWDFVMDYYWPPILDYIFIQAILEDPGDSTSDLEGYVTANIFKADQYNGPCNAHMVETWYKDVPPLIEPDVLLPNEIDFQGADLRIYVPRSLHGRYVIWDSGVSQVFPATDPQFWPASVIASVDITPQNGGWLQRVLTVDAPSLTGQSSGLVLSVSLPTVDGFTLSWTPQVGGSNTTSVNVAQSPEFDTGFLPGYQGLVVAAGTNTVAVTGAEQGRPYYAQVTRNGVVSNIVFCQADPSAILQVLLNGIVLSSTNTVDAGTSAPGQTTQTPLTLRNTGSQILTNIVASLTGDDDQFTLSNISTALNPGQSQTLTVSFTPTSGGAKSAELSIAHDGEGSNPFLLTLSGSSVAPELRVEEPLNTVIPPEGTIDFGDFTTTAITKTIYLRNTGTAELEDIVGSISGLNSQDFEITTSPASTLAQAATTSLVVTFLPSPDESSPNQREATLSFTSNDPDSPYTVNLTGLYDPPEAPGALDLGFVANFNGPVYAIAADKDGSIYVGGQFDNVNGDGVDNLVKLDSTGARDGSFSCTVNNTVRALAIDADGNLLVGGLFTEIGFEGIPYIARVSDTGTVDVTFNPIAGDVVTCIAVQPDGKILIGGDFLTVGGGNPPFLARLETDGSVDATFDSEVNGIVYAIVVLPDGKILIGGDWEGGGTTPPPTTEPPPTTIPIPTTLPPTTEVFTTAPPTPPPTTVPPTTPIPTTPPPTTPPPPTTGPPTTEPPPPTTEPPPPTTEPP